MAEGTTSESSGAKGFSIGRGRGILLRDMDGGTVSSGFGSGYACAPQTHASDVRSRGRSLAQVGHLASSF